MHDDKRPRIRYAGIDTHKDTNMAALLDEAGRVVAVEEFGTDEEGCARLAAFVADRSVKVGIEGSRSYGTSVAAHLSGLGYEVFEVVRPRRQQRRRGKSDERDAVSAARNLMAGEGVPLKRATRDVEDLRFLLTARRAAVKCATASANRIDAMLVCSDDPIRRRFSGTDGDGRARAILSCRLGGGCVEALKSCARALLSARREAEALEEKMRPLVLRACPALVAARGVGVVVAATLAVAAGSNPSRMGSEAAFSMFCGTSPIPASSGKTTRHRLNRGGDRGANQAIHEIARVRMATDERTRVYVRRKVSEGKSGREAVRCLCRFIAREVYGLLTAEQEPLPSPGRLADARRAAGLTQAGLAEMAGVGCARIAHMESGRTIDGELMRACAELLGLADAERPEKGH